MLVNHQTVNPLYYIWFAISRSVRGVLGDRLHARLYNAWLWIRAYFHGRARLRRFARGFQGNPKCHLAVCAIMKNEGSYLEEWIDFHRLVGVERFYLYLNNCTDNTMEVLKPYVEEGIVEAIIFNGERKQIPAYENCVERHFNDTEWIGFIDLDEFIVPCGDFSVPEFLRSLPVGYNQVLANWLVFGSGGASKRERGSVVERFIRRGRPGAPMSREKAFVRPRMVYRTDPHVHFVGGRTIRLPESQLRIHHYHCKSWEEYAQRSGRGDVRFGPEAGINKYCRACFDAHDLNDIEDRTAIEFVSRTRKTADNTK